MQKLAQHVQAEQSLNVNHVLADIDYLIADHVKYLWMTVMMTVVEEAAMMTSKYEIRLATYL